jgi:hypothetical protein
MAFERTHRDIYHRVDNYFSSYLRSFGERCGTAAARAADSDRIISRRATEWILQHAKNAEVAEMDGPHLLLQSKAGECAVPVLRFMRRCAAVR